MAEPDVNELMENRLALQASRFHFSIFRNLRWDQRFLGLRPSWRGAQAKRQGSLVAIHDRDREDVVGLDATIIMHPKVWEASKHTSTFSDPMVDCKDCKGRFRADQVDSTPCPKKPSKMVTECGSEKTEPRAFNLMFKTYVGPVETEDNVAYLRPETAQAIFAQFKNVSDISRQKVPFGICQIGKAFRNEINPRNYTFRSREFEQMELEFFIKPDEVAHAEGGAPAEDAPVDSPAPNWGWKQWHQYWVEQRLSWYESIGLPADSLELHWQTDEELAHYARATVDIMFKFPFGVQELEGIAARSNYDLTQHQEHSGKSMDYFDEEAKQRYIPHVIEPSAGVDRMILALICNAYHEAMIPNARVPKSVWSCNSTPKWLPSKWVSSRF